MEGDREHGERAGLAGHLNVAVGEHGPGLVPELEGGVAGEPEPTGLLLPGDLLAQEPGQRPLQHRRARGVSLHDHQGPAIQQQVGRARGPLRSEGRACALRDLQRTAAGGEPPGEQCRRERVEVGLAREPHVQRLEPFGGLEQQRRSVTAASHGERDLAAQQVYTRAPELVELASLGSGQ